MKKSEKATRKRSVPFQMQIIGMVVSSLVVFGMIFLLTSVFYTNESKTLFPLKIEEADETQFSERFTYQLPEVAPEQMTACFYSDAQKIRVWIDQDQRYYREGTFHNISGIWVTIPILGRDSGKSLKIEIDGATVTTVAAPLVLGEEGAVARRLSGHRTFGILLGILSLLSGIFLFWMNFWSRSRKMLLLVLTAVLSGGWRLGKMAVAFGMFAGGDALLQLFLLCCLSAIPVCVVLFLNEEMPDVLSKRTKVLLFIVCGLNVLAVAGTAFSWFSVRKNAAFFMAATLLLISALFFVCTVKKKGWRRTFLHCSAHHTVFFLFLAGEFILEALMGGFLYSGCLFEIGFLIYLWTAALLNAQKKTVPLKDKDKQFYENALPFSVHPHFLFNTLSAIRVLCRKDPKEAEETVMLLAEYLRYRMDPANQEGAIPFLTEVQYTETYIALEKVRFGSRIQWKKILHGAQFQIPAFSVYAIVEAMIRQGKKQSKQWEICLKAEENSEAFSVCIWDGLPWGEEELARFDKEVLTFEKQRMEQINGTAAMRYDSDRGLFVEFQALKEGIEKGDLKNELYCCR